MGITSLQVCMDSSDDWLQGTTVSEEGTDQTSSDHDILVACSGTLIERRLRPQHEQSLKCPRCESTYTKFCYYNNYSLSQPRYFCKTCRRYWTKGGTLRNIPVGGGCRKNKKVSTSSKKNNSNNEKNDINDSSNNNNDHNISVNHSPGSLLSSSSSFVQPSNNLNGLMSPSPSAFSCFNLNSHSNNPSSADLHRPFIPETPFASLSSNALGFLTSDTTNPIFILENNPTPINFMVENTLVSGGQDFMGLHAGENFDGVNVINDGLMTTYNANLHGMTASSLDHHDMSMTSPAVVNDNNAIMVESFQRMMMPYDQNHHHQHLIIDDHQIQEVEDVKPISTRILPLEWHDYNNHLHHRNTNSTTEIKDHSFGYNLGGLGSWTSLMNGHGSSATNPLV